MGFKPHVRCRLTLDLSAAVALPRRHIPVYIYPTDKLLVHSNKCIDSRKENESEDRSAMSIYKVENQVTFWNQGNDVWS
jgi:hypothetical protein